MTKRRRIGLIVVLLALAAVPITLHGRFGGHADGEDEDSENGCGGVQAEAPKPGVALAVHAEADASSADGLTVNSVTLDGATVTSSTSTKSEVFARLTECPSDRWCSALYPVTWTPAQEPDSAGRFLHDFSFAGYRHGATPVANEGTTFDVSAYGADDTGARDSSAAVQSAIDAAAREGRGVVRFPAGTYRFDRTVNVRSSNIVLRGTGAATVLRFTNGRGITFAGSVKRTPAKLLVADGRSRDASVLVADASGLALGDDVAVGWKITPEFIADHGMTGTWKAFNGKYQRFFRATVLAVDTSAKPHRITLDVPLRYTAKVRDGAAIEKESGYLREVGIEDLSVTNATTWQSAWSETHVAALGMANVTDAWVRNVHSVATPGATGKDASDERAYHLRSGGLVIEDSKRVSVLSSSMENPQNRGEGGNGYLFEVARTNEVLFADDIGRNGRHNFIQNWGFGTSGTVFLRCVSAGSECFDPKMKASPGSSEHHHSLAMATLVDDCEVDDGFRFENRREMSDGAGHTSTESVVWRPHGKGVITSRQFGWGYVIGARDGVDVVTDVENLRGAGTAPADYVEGNGEGETLFPSSLYEDQRARRLSAP